ncbi:MAG: primosomal protein N' [Phycisphaerae bacterium]|nr:primosomal protein N' [Phycisphaerae bacterium]
MRINQTKSLFSELDIEPAAVSNSRDCDSGHVIKVAFSAAVDNEFDYIVDDEFWPVKTGQRVLVPFGRGNKPEQGFCVEIVEDVSEPSVKQAKRFRLKKIKEVIDDTPLLNAELMELAGWISRYYVCPLGQVLAAMVPAAVKKSAGVKKQRFVYLPENFKTLSEKIRGKKQKDIIDYLLQQNALNSENAIEAKIITVHVGCTDAPIKSLANKEIVRLIKKEILKALPVIPDEFILEPENVVLNSDQSDALKKIQEDIRSGDFGVSLLHGVTDSGKTEVYIRAIQTAIDSGKSAIVLLPEIALTAQTIERFSGRFTKLAVMHSGLTPSQRNLQWQKIKNAEADVVIGARSAIFAPLANLGLIVVDEEHEPCYKQDTTPRYNARDVAIKRIQLCNGHCILGSATPSLETVVNCKNKKHFQLLSLPKRVMDLPMPKMHLIDMKQEYSEKNKPKLISKGLQKHLEIALRRNEQAILLLNRRGYSNFVFCPSCKHTLRCRNCDVSLTFHKSASKNNNLTKIFGKQIHSGYATCHYCLSKTLVQQKCPICGKSMIMIGLGSQRLEEEIKDKFPSARVARVDSDSMKNGNYYELLRDFSNGTIDILVGTQMIAKGLHFPNVTVVGIISADTSLYIPDFRANERTFQLISQVAGRTGRSEKEGKVFVQTYLSEQPAIKYALKNDFTGFVENELEHRKTCNLPPYSRMAYILIQDTNYEKLELATKIFKDRLDNILAENSLNIKLRGPMPAAISRMHRFHRNQIIVQSPNAEPMQRFFKILRRYKPVRPAVKVSIDIDPVNLL